VGKERICCVCRTLGCVSWHIRVARIDGKFKIDKDGNANGRGCYICKNCIDDCIKKRALNRSFKTQVPDEIYQQLKDCK